MVAHYLQLFAFYFRHVYTLGRNDKRIVAFGRTRTGTLVLPIEVLGYKRNAHRIGIDSPCGQSVYGVGVVGNVGVGRNAVYFGLRLSCPAPVAFVRNAEIEREVAVGDASAHNV